MNNASRHIFKRLFSRLGAASTLLLLVCVPLTACNAPEVPDDADLYARVVEGNVFDTTPVYGKAVPLRLRRTGFEYRCSECHTDFEHTITSNRPQGEHPDILSRFDHGRTIYCLTCHHQSDRNSYVDNIGQPMSADHSEELCARCHGPKYRDWEAGTHGRINGHWNEKFGERKKLTCVQCHDPHMPRFPNMAPSPPHVRSRLDAGTRATLALTETTGHGERSKPEKDTP